MYNKIKADTLMYRKAKDKFALTVMTTLKGELGRVCDGKPETLSDEKIVTVMRKMVANLDELIPHMTDDDKKVNAAKEIAILAEYLPPMMSEEMLRAIIEADILTNDYKTMKDMGKIMGSLKKNDPDQAIDMKLASSIIKQIFTGKQ